MATSAPSSALGSSTATKEPKLSDDQIIEILQYGINQSVGYSQSKLSKEGERVLKYADGELPRKAHAGDSGYNSLDVYTATAEMQAQLLDAFSASFQPVKFIPANGEDVQAAQIRTDYVTNVVFDQNPGYAIFRDTIDQALIRRNAICKVWWETKRKTEYVSLTDVAFHELAAYLQQHADEEPKVTEQHVREDNTSFTRVTVRLKKDASQVRIVPLAGEEFGISPMASSIEEADLVFHRHEKTVSELLKMGFDKKVVDGLETNDRLWLSMEPERIARFEQTDDLIGTRVTETGQNARRVIMVYECYTELDLEDTGESQLFKVTMVGTTILEKEPVDRKPFVAFIPLPRPRAFWGHNYGNLLIHTQNARTYLTRAIINHSATTTNPRLMVVKGAVANPRELVENKFGGLVNVSRPDGIIPLPQAPLNPFVMTTLQMLQANREEITSISSLSQGLNKDAISKQNSQAMVQDLITVSQLRQKIIARNFAEGFLRDLYMEVYRLVLENESRQKIVQIAGSWVPVDFSQWPEDTRLDVAFCLGYGEQDKEAEKWAQIHAALSSMPALAANYTPTQQYAVARKGLEAKGVKDVNTYLLPPPGQPPPPDPMKQAEIAMKQADAKAKEAAAQATVVQSQQAMAELQSKERIEMARIALEREKFQFEMQNKTDTLAHKVAIDAAQLKLEQMTLAAGKLQGEANAGS